MQIRIRFVVTFDELADRACWLKFTLKTGSLRTVKMADGAVSNSVGDGETQTNADIENLTQYVNKRDVVF